MDQALHRKVDIFLAKTGFANRLLKAYVYKLGLQGRVQFVGHTSSDPSVIYPPGATANLSATARSIASQAYFFDPKGRDFSQVLHVKGKSGLKHSRQVLECWATHPSWPLLTVVGDVPWGERETQAVINLTNVFITPRPHPPSEPGGPPASEKLATFDELRLLLNGIGVHLCPSEREGFGHYLNEARAVSAYVVTTDHPPMNEMVSQGQTGFLIKPAYTHSYTEWMALGDLTHIIAHVNVKAMCAGVAEALGVGLEERERRGWLARQAYLAGRRRFVRRLRDLLQHLKRLRQQRAAGGGGGSGSGA